MNSPTDKEWLDAFAVEQPKTIEDVKRVVAVTLRKMEGGAAFARIVGDFLKSHEVRAIPKVSVIHVDIKGHLEAGIRLEWRRPGYATPLRTTHSFPFEHAVVLAYDYNHDALTAWYKRYGVPEQFGELVNTCAQSRRVMTLHVLLDDTRDFNEVVADMFHDTEGVLSWCCVKDGDTANYKDVPVCRRVSVPGSVGVDDLPEWLAEHAGMLSEGDWDA